MAEALSVRHTMVFMCWYKGLLLLLRPLWVLRLAVASAASGAILAASVANGCGARGSCGGYGNMIILSCSTKNAHVGQPWLLRTYYLKNMQIMMWSEGQAVQDMPPQPHLFRSFWMIQNPTLSAAMHSEISVLTPRLQRRFVSMAMSDSKTSELNNMITVGS
jgi:hypothetical protein